MLTLFLSMAGPIVRISPDEIDICDVDIVKDMSKTGSGFLKSAWYDSLAVGGYKNIFSVRDPKAHSIRRRLLSSPMADSSLQAIEPTIDAKARLAVSQMQKETKERGAMDVFKWWYFMSTDIIGELSFGESFQLLERGEVGASLLQTSLEYIANTTAYVEKPVCDGSGKASEAGNDRNSIPYDYQTCTHAANTIFP